MSTDSAAGRLAMQRVISASADIEVQLSTQSGTRPVLLVLHMARTEAAVALELLAGMDLANEANVGDVRAQQIKVQRYEDLIRWFRKIVSDGFDHDQEITSDDREELIELLARTPEGAEEAMELGLIERTQ